MTNTAPITLLTKRFSDAVAYAADLHRDQPRKGSNTPYMAHLLGAASLVLDQGGDEDEAIAALLHDALEDQSARTSEAEIRERFGAKVARIVVACSDSMGGEKEEWKPRKERYLEHLQRQPEDVRRVCLADKLHNARAIVADLRTAGDSVWDRFTGDPAEQAWYYNALARTFQDGHHSPLVGEFAAVVAELDSRARQAPPRASTAP